MNQVTWSTPQKFFDMINAEFGFTLDVCAVPENAKCEKFFNPEQDGLKQDWKKDVFWMNPPYGRSQNVYQWVKKAFSSVWAGNMGVCLLPATLDVRWFHHFVVKGASEIRVVEDRLWFSLNGGEPKRANHGSIVVIIRPFDTACRISSISNCRGE